MTLTFDLLLIIKSNIGKLHVLRWHLCFTNTLLVIFVSIIILFYCYLVKSVFFSKFVVKYLLILYSCVAIYSA